MVAVHVHSQLHHLLIEGLDNLLKCEMIELLELCWIWSIIFDHISCHFVDQGLHSSSPMDVERDVDQVSQASHHDPVECLRVCHLDDLLAQVIAELVCHHIGKNGQYLIDQAFKKQSFIWAVKIILLNFGLKISASRLIEAVVVKGHEDLLLFSCEGSLLLLDWLHLECLGKAVIGVSEQSHRIEFIPHKLNITSRSAYLILLLF